MDRGLFHVAGWTGRAKFIAVYEAVSGSGLALGMGGGVAGLIVLPPCPKCVLCHAARVFPCHPSLTVGFGSRCKSW